MKVHLCRVSEVYSRYASSVQVDVKTLSNFGDCSEDVQLEVFFLQVGRWIDNEHNVGLLTTLYHDWLWNKFDKIVTQKP